jgi:hypothetical protein
MAAPVLEIMDTPSYAKLQVMSNVQHNIDCLCILLLGYGKASAINSTFSSWRYSPIQVLIIFVAVIFTD